MFPELEMFHKHFDVDVDFLNYISYDPYNFGYNVEMSKNISIGYYCVKPIWIIKQMIL